MSEEKCWYFSSFKLCAVDILDSLGTVNSKISKTFDFLSTITMSGFKGVINIFITITMSGFKGVINIV